MTLSIAIAVILIVALLRYRKRTDTAKHNPIVERYPNDKVLIDLINEHRGRLGLSLLQSEVGLTELARQQAYWLEANVKDRDDFEVKGHYFLADRETKSKHGGNYGEITCYNMATEKSKLAGYLASEDHKACIENPNFTHIGSATTNRINFIIFAKY